jgi:O-methyltransferase
MGRLKRVFGSARRHVARVRDALLSRAAARLGLVCHRFPPRYSGQGAIPDWACYRPSEHGDWLFSPWNGLRGVEEYLTVAAPYTVIAPERLYVLVTLARQALTLPGDYVECGVFKGGSAMMLALLLERESLVPGRLLHLFDTFTGMPASDRRFDTYYKGGEFSDTSVEGVRQRIPQTDLVRFIPGRIPETFADVSHIRIAFAHIDVDIYAAVRDCCAFIYPRLVVGGFMVFDDYAWSTCPGARRAVDEYFAQRRVRPLVLQNGQALVFKSASED